MTLPVSGTGSAGMEACFTNAVEEGGEVVIAVNGVFGTRMCDAAARQGTKVVRGEVPWGGSVDPEDVRRAPAQGRRPCLVALAHAETSTGVGPALQKIVAYAHEFETLFPLDPVTSLGGCEVETDSRVVDLCYSGTRKYLNPLPGLSLLTVSVHRALDERDRVYSVRAIRYIARALLRSLY